MNAYTGVIVFASESIIYVLGEVTAYFGDFTKHDPSHKSKIAIKTIAERTRMPSE